MPEWKKIMILNWRKEKNRRDFGSKIDTEPKIHEFTAETGLQVLFDANTATLSDFLNLFLTDKFFQLISRRENLYAQ